VQTFIPNLWVNDGKIDEAVEHWCSVFPDSRVVGTTSYGEDAGEWAGTTMAAYFELHGQTFVAINGAGTSFTPSEAVSLAVPCDSQEEIDAVWEGLADGGQPGPCGWLKDRYGFSWQVYPTRLDEMMRDPDKQAVARVTACFMKVDGVPLSLADLEAAYAGPS
jgi:predicted 3-demethylubiquinone-9 3-methyltransferase (glyoxalase superfamily)